MSFDLIAFEDGRYLVRPARPLDVMPISQSARSWFGEDAVPASRRREWYGLNCLGLWVWEYDLRIDVVIQFHVLRKPLADIYNSRPREEHKTIDDIFCAEELFGIARPVEIYQELTLFNGKINAYALGSVARCVPKILKLLRPMGTDLDVLMTLPICFDVYQESQAQRLMDLFGYRPTSLVSPQNGRAVLATGISTLEANMKFSPITNFLG